MPDTSNSSKIKQGIGLSISAAIGAIASSAISDEISLWEYFSKLSEKLVGPFGALILSVLFLCAVSWHLLRSNKLHRDELEKKDEFLKELLDKHDQLVQDKDDLARDKERVIGCVAKEKDKALSSCQAARIRDFKIAVEKYEHSLAAIKSQQKEVLKILTELQKKK